MHILLLNHYAGSPQHGMEHRPYHLAREWVRAGHTVTVVAGSYSHLRVRNPRMSAAMCEEDIDGVHYVWLRTPRYEGNGVRRIASMVAFVGQVYRFARILATPRPDVVVASSTYPLDIFPARRIARRAGATLVFEVHDLWPLSPRELGGYSAAHPFVLCMQFAEDSAYAYADRVVSLLPGTLPHMLSRGMAAGKFAWIPNGLDFDDGGAPTPDLPPTHAQAIAEARARGDLIVGYAGSHGLANALNVLLDAAVLTKDMPVTFLLVGDGPDKADLQDRARACGLRAVQFLAPIPRRAVPQFVSGIDVAYLGWHRSPLYRFGIAPNKLLDYMAAGRPVLHAVEAFNDPVHDAACGISVPPSDAAALAGAIQQFLAMSPSERESMGRNGIAYVRRHHDYRHLAERFLSFATGENRAG